MRGAVEGPRLRASLAKRALAYLDEYRAGLRAAVEAKLPDESLEFLNNAPGNAWMSIDVDAPFNAAQFEVLGQEADDCWRSSVTVHAKSPLLRAVITGMNRLFSGDDSRFVSMSVSRGWTLAYRDFAKVYTLDRAPGRVVFAFEDVDERVFDLPGYPASWAAALGGLADLTGKGPSTVMRVEERVRRRIEYDIQWDPGESKPADE